MYEVLHRSGAEPREKAKLLLPLNILLLSSHPHTVQLEFDSHPKETTSLSRNRTYYHTLTRQECVPQARIGVFEMLKHNISFHV